jgi:hypothetical protein
MMVKISELFESFVDWVINLLDCVMDLIPLPLPFAAVLVWAVIISVVAVIFTAVTALFG